jgi:DNA-binding NtrC family response regulator
MQAVFDQIERVAETEATVLITGESGTGKELVAEAIHRRSQRSHGPLSAVNMAAVPDTLVESELFGHVQGAFTGAATDRTGRFEGADGGTLFIDEIGDLRLTSQAKLLRVLENRRITPVGGDKSREVDVRVVAATNKRLETMVADGRFREDLYYRLNVVMIRLPPLRERREDIPVLVRHFLGELCETYGRPMPDMDNQLEEFLAQHDWPGNVRQLRNSIESMMVLADSRPLTRDDLPAMVRERQHRPENLLDLPIDMTLEELERAAIRQSLRRFDDNRTRAARSLGISVRTLQRKLKKWGAEGGNGSGPGQEGCCAEARSPVAAS